MKALSLTEIKQGYLKTLENKKADILHKIEKMEEEAILIQDEIDKVNKELNSEKK